MHNVSFCSMKKGHFGKLLDPPCETDEYHIFNYLSMAFEVEKRRPDSSEKKVKGQPLFTAAHCLKITQNVAFEFFSFGIFPQLLSY